VTIKIKAIILLNEKPNMYSLSYRGMFEGQILELRFNSPIVLVKFYPNTQYETC